jgi:hypothetical protein
MASPEWRRLPDAIKLGFVVHREEHKRRIEAKMAMEMQQAIQAEAMRAAAAGQRGGTVEPPPLGPGGGPPKPSRGAPGGEHPTTAGVSRAAES